MKSIILIVLLASSFAFAQRRERILAPRDTPLPVPLAIGGGFMSKQPKLRSWVQGWTLTGTRLDAYEVRCDEVFTDCEIPILRTKAFKSEPFGMGSLTHVEPVDVWRGRRVEVRAELKPGGLDGWAGLWMRVDGPNGQVLAFDNMQNRPLRGTGAFRWYSVVLDVPEDAVGLSFGVMLHGPGAVFVRELVFEESETTTASTDLLPTLKTAP